MNFVMSPRIASLLGVVAVPLVVLGAGCSSDNSLPGSTGNGSPSGATGASGGSEISGSSGPSGAASGTGVGVTGASGTGATGTGAASGTGAGAAGAASGTGVGVTGASGTGATGAGAASGTGASGTASGAAGSAASGSNAGGSSDAGTGGGASGSAAGGTGGTGDAGKGGPSLCTQAKAPPISATICDGFETMPSDFTATPAGSMTADTTQSYRGATSMKFSSSTMAYLTESKTFTGTTKATNNNFWGRYFFLSDVATIGAVPQSHAVFGTMVGTDTSNASADQFHFVGGARGKLQTQIQFAGDVFSDNEKTPAATDPDFPLMAAGWQCWEWNITADDSYYFYINGAEVKEMEIIAGKGTNNGGNFSPLPTITSLEIGWQYFGTGLYAGWIDEVAVGPNRIGCGN